MKHAKKQQLYIKQCRFTEEDVEELRKLAMLSGLSVSDIIRIAVKLFLKEPELDFQKM